MTEQTQEELSDILTVDGVTLTMYAGVIVKIDEAIGGFESLDELPVNPNLQSKMVEAIVTKYDENGNKDGYMINPFKIKSGDFQKIYEWGLKHYEVFILNSSTKTMKMLKNIQTTITGFPINS